MTFLLFTERPLDTSRERQSLCFCCKKKKKKEVSMPYLCKDVFENTNNRSAPSKPFQVFFQAFFPKGCILLESFP